MLGFIVETFVAGRNMTQDSKYKKLVHLIGGNLGRNRKWAKSVKWLKNSKNASWSCSITNYFEDIRFLGIKM